MTRTSPLRSALLVALLCAVGLRLLTPPGWMPNLDGRPDAPLVICTGAGVHVVRAPDPASHGRSAKGGHEVCAFAGFALGAAPQAAALTGTPIPPRQAADAPGARDQIQSAPERRRPQAPRAPPLTA